MENLRLGSTKTINQLSTDLETSHRSLEEKGTELNNLEEQINSLSRTLSQLRNVSKDLEQQHAVLQESLRQATEIGGANEATIEKLKSELSTANNEVRNNSVVIISIWIFIVHMQTQIHRENYYAEKRDKEQTAEELEILRLESTETINRLTTDLEASHRSLEARNTELNHVVEQFRSVSQTLSRLRKVDNIEGLHEAREIGRGSYGAVYEVRVNSVPCIAKRVLDILVGRGKEEPVGDEERMAIVRLFHEECDLLSTLHHPNVVQFMGVHYGHDEADTSLIMEHMHMDLERCMKKYPNIPLPYKTSILRDVAYGLAYLHSIPIIHRDLNTGNILLTESLRAKVADLGVSKLFDRKVVHTRTKVPGAMDFMPPECFDESPKYDDKLDIFSFGHLTICLVNQKSPLVADKNLIPGDVENGQVQVGKRRESLSRMGSTHPLYSTVVQCLSDNPDRRPTSTVLVKMLEDTCEQYPVAHRNPLDALASKRQEIIRQSAEVNGLHDS